MTWSLGYEQCYRVLPRLTAFPAVLLSCTDFPALARRIRRISARLAESRLQIPAADQQTFLLGHSIDLSRRRRFPDLKILAGNSGTKRSGRDLMVRGASER